MIPSLTFPHSSCLQCVGLYGTLAPYSPLDQEKFTIKPIAQVIVPPDIAVPRLGSAETLVIHVRCTVCSHLGGFVRTSHQTTQHDATYIVYGGCISCHGGCHSTKEKPLTSMLSKDHEPFQS